jgi:L,D-transpeptidase YcbB
VARHIAVAGKPDRPSPDINSKIVQINFHPFWTVPVSIVREDLIPKMQAEPDYLTKNHIRLFDAKNIEQPPSRIDWYSTEAVNYKFEQDAGEFQIRSARSPHGVYMHDTPAKNLFGEDFSLCLDRLRARARMCARSSTGFCRRGRAGRAPRSAR